MKSIKSIRNREMFTHDVYTRMFLMHITTIKPRHFGDAEIKICIN
jgi:hypothetical protein